MAAHPDDTDGAPTRRGGGPPGGSAFLSSRLRRSREEAEAAAARRSDPTSAFDFTPFADAPAFTGAPSAASTGAASGGGSRPIVRSFSDDDFTNDALTDDRFTSDTSTSDTSTGDAFTTDAFSDAPASTAPRSSSFPGGRVRLPRLGESAHSPDLTFVGTAFVRRPGDGEVDDDERKGAFEEYFTYESLFSEPIAEPLRIDASMDGDDPYQVLGVSPEASWKEIVAAHRALVKTHHPDRLIDANPEDVERSEEALRLINRAYGELRRRGRDAEDDA